MTRTDRFFISSHAPDGSGQVSAVHFTIGTQALRTRAGQAGLSPTEFQFRLLHRLEDKFPQAKIHISMVAANNDGTWTIIADDSADEPRILYDCRDILEEVTNAPEGRLA